MPDITIEKLKYKVGKPTYDKGVALYNAGKVKLKFELVEKVFEFEVQGTQKYSVILYQRSFEHSICNCYVGQKNMYCKHLVAVALSSIKENQPLTQEEREYLDSIKCSNKLGELTESEMKKTEELITKNLKYIKPYSGSSRDWDSYQSSLSEGADRMVPLISKLPISLQTAKLLVKVLLRLENKVMNVVDDSDGTVGDLMVDIVSVLKQFIKKDPECLQAIKKLENLETSFGWEEELVKMLYIS